MDFLVEQMAGAGPVSARKMFGEYGVFLDGKMPALMCDDRLFVKPTPPGRAFIGTVTEQPPYQGAKPCFLIDGDRWDDPAWLSELIRITAAALPAPKKKRLR